jgi:hypothetical protein
MKLVAVALLVLGMLCNSMLAMAEGPVPFNALMQTAGAQPSVPPITDTKDKSTALSAQPTHTRMTSGGKIMTGTGIGMLVIGVAAVGGTAIVRTALGGVTSAKEDALFATGGALVAGGVTLIVFGSHRRSAK